MTGPHDRPASPETKALFAAGIGAVAIGRAVTALRSKAENRKRPPKALHQTDERGEQ